MSKFLYLIVNIIFFIGKKIKHLTTLIVFKQFTWTGHVDKNGEAFVIMFEGVDCQELEELRKLTDLDRSNKKND